MIQSTFPVRQIGDFEITALSDGVLSARLDLLSGIENAAANEIQDVVHPTCASVNQNNSPPAPDEVAIDVNIAGFRDACMLLDFVCRCVAGRGAGLFPGTSRCVGVAS